jgi:hypothetical protein
MKPPKFVLRRKETGSSAAEGVESTENHREMQGWRLLESLAIWARANDCDSR